MNRDKQGKFKRTILETDTIIVIGAIALFVLYSMLPKYAIYESVYEVDQPRQPIEVIYGYYKGEVETLPTPCDLSFYSYKINSPVQTPEAYKETIKDLPCEDQKLLTKLAHYESEWNPNSVNPSNTYARGLYHVLPTTRDFCDVRGINTERDCALFVIKNYPSWYLMGYEQGNTNYQLSFK